MEAKAADGEPVDLHREFSSPLPTHVLGSLLGVPDEDRHLFDPWVRALTRLQDAEGVTNWAPVMAGTVLTTLPMIIIFLILQKPMIKGLTAGAVKG